MRSIINLGTTCDRVWHYFFFVTKGVISVYTYYKCAQAKTYSELYAIDRLNKFL